MKAPTIRVLGISVIAATLLTGAVYVTSSYLIHDKIQNSRQIWNEYQRISANKAQSLSSIVRNMGYGGMIHYFKEFVIKGENELAQQATLRAGAAIAAIDSYKASPTNASERAALAAIRKTIMQYMAAINTANEAIMDGETARNIDRLIKTNDAPALLAIKTLRKNSRDSSTEQNDRSSKTEQYGKMLSALGYGGLVHNFNNYILRQDTKIASETTKNIKSYRKAANTYLAFGTNKTEQKALKQIEKTIRGYEKDLKEAITLIKAGNLPADISHRLKPDVKSMMSGLQTLNSSIEAQILNSKRKLSRDLKQASSSSMSVLWIALIATGLLACLNCLIIFIRLIGPIRQIRNTMFTLAHGDMDVKVNYITRSDEIGSMARAIEVFRNNALDMNRLEKEAVLKEQEAIKERKSTMMALAQNFENSVGSVVVATKTAISSLEETACRMIENANTSSEQADNVNYAAQESASSVAIVATSSVELENSITHISREVEQSKKMASTALAESENSKQTMRELMDRTGKINNIVGMINDIAGQTNLLALNATIEASRAGEAGRGFAIVASEVKTLAEQTSKATDEIAHQINALQKISSQAANNMDEIDTVIARMNEFSNSVAGAIAEQSAATSEIAHNIEIAAAGSGEVTQGISMVRSAAGETGETANQLKSYAKDLSEQSELLDQNVANFVGTIRTAW